MPDRNATISGTGSKRHLLSAVIFPILVFTYIVWVFSFPVFPTQDGPIHLYYTHVLNELESGNKLFTQFFAVRHPIPPYAVHYLLLSNFMQFWGPATAEKLIVCLAIFLSAYGFRSLMKSVYPEALDLSILGIPISLNWTIGMGFHNFALSFGLSLFALALWISGRRENSAGKRALVVAIALLMLFTHPVPLLVVIVFIWSDLILQSLFRRTLATTRADLVTAFVVSATLLYVMLFVSKGRTSEDLHHALFQAGLIRDFLLGRPLVLVGGTFGSEIYHVFLVVIAVAGLLAALRIIRANMASRSWNPVVTISVVAVGLLIVYPFVPRRLNGSDFFADRLCLYVWLFLILSMASRFAVLKPRTRAVFFGAMAFVSLFVLAVNDGEIRTASRLMTQLENTPLRPSGSRGIFINAPILPAKLHLTFDPYIWSAARYFRKTDTVMMNAPWIDLPILPITRGASSASGELGSRLTDYPDRLAGVLIRDQAERDRLGSKLDFILFIGASGQNVETRDQVVEQRWPKPWSCRRDSWIGLCSTN